MNHLENLLKHGHLGLTPRHSDIMGCRWDTEICLFNKLPGNVDAADHWTVCSRRVLLQVTVLTVTLTQSGVGLQSQTLK